MLNTEDSILSPKEREDDVLQQNLSLQPYLPFTRPGQKVDEKEFLRTLLLYMGGKLSLLPELVEILPLDKILLFLNIFSGQKINIPEKNILQDSLKDINIYFSLSLNPTTDEVFRLARQYDLTPQTVRGIAEKISELLGKPNPLKSQ